MSLDKLKKYKINKAYTEGVEVYLDEAPDCPFIIKLPGQYNRSYMAELYGNMDLTFDEDGNFESNAKIMDAKNAQESAFVNHCLVSIDGEKPPENFADEYPEALAELIAKSTELANDIQAGVDDAAKKSAPTSSGKISGAAA